MAGQGLLQSMEGLGDQQTPAMDAGESLQGWNIKMQEQKQTHMADSSIFCLLAALPG